MNRDQETAETWDKMASLYQEKFMTLDIYNESYDFICESITGKGARILDIGCGPGNISKYLLSKRPDFEIFGIDLSPNMIQLARQNIPNGKFSVMDSRDISGLTTKFDALICGFCLPYLSPSDADKLIQDCSGLLNENGLLYLSFVEGDPAESEYKTGTNGNRVFFHYHDIKEITRQLLNYSFEGIKKTILEFSRTETKVELHTILTASKTA